jgi:VanZ family protein
VLSQNKFLIVAILWTLLITFLSLNSLNNFDSPIKFANKDKFAHFVFYFVFVFVWILYSKQKLIYPKNGFNILIIAIMYGIIMEVFQGLFTTNRKADIFDVLANSAGALTSFFVLRKYYKQ